MGRTLHYNIRRKNGLKLTIKQRKVMMEIAEKYNTGKFEKAWTCENYYFTAENYYPNWKNYGGKVESWEEVNAEYEKMEALGMDAFTIINELVKGGIVKRHEEDLKNVHGFTKTQGNEYNSLLVYTALLELSKRLTDTTIHLYDEGEFLVCPLFIKNGLVKPDFEEVNENRAYYLKNIAEGRKFFNDYLNKLDAKMAQVNHIIKQNDGAEWLDPVFLARTVNPDDFTEYKGTLMGGFYGEYFGMDTTGQADKANQRMREFMHMLTENIPDCKVISIEDKNKK